MATVGRVQPKRKSTQGNLDQVPDDDRDELKELIEQELDCSCPTYARRNKPKIEILGTQLNEFDVRPEHKVLIQEVGKKTGCHTCATKIHTDATQNWIADHQPPKALTNSARTAFGLTLGDNYYLFPQCDTCAAQQAAIVGQLNAGTTAKKDLTPFGKALIYGGSKAKGNPAKYGVHTTNGGDPGKAERESIQELGKQNGCHSCGTIYPVQIYIADHIYPQEMMTNYMKEIFDLLDLDYPAQQEFRPQCKRCSTQQGGRWTKVSQKATALSQLAGVKNYKQTAANERRG